MAATRSTQQSPDPAEGRTRTAKPVRERLLDAADAVLFVDGVPSAPVDRILKHAGASPPSLYTHFGNKEGLLVAALKRRLDVWREEWTAAIDAAADDEERLLCLWSATRTYQRVRLTERWCAFSGTAASIDDPTPELQAVLDEETAMLYDRTYEHALPLVGHDTEAARQLSEQLVVVYLGSLALMLRREYEVALTAGERTARTLVRAFGSAHGAQSSR